MKRTIGALTILLTAGCLGVLPGGEADSAIAARCERGSGPLFINAQHHPGFISYDYQLIFYALDREHDLFYLRANEAVDPGYRPLTGTGRLVPKSGALHNVTLAETKAEFQRTGGWHADRDYNVTVAWRDRVATDRFASLCDKVLDEFYRYRARYDDNNIVDCDGFTFRISTERGPHSSYSYCKTGPQGMRNSFDDVADASREKLGVEGL